MAEFPAPSEGIVLTHFVAAQDVARSCAFYTDVLGGAAVPECFLRDPDGHLIEVGQSIRLPPGRAAG